MYFLRSKLEGDQLCFAFKKRGTSSQKVRFKFLFLTYVSSSIIKDLARAWSFLATSFSINNLKLLAHKNYFLISITTFELNKNIRVSSIGILGNLFVFKEKIKKNIITFGNDINKSIERSFDAKKMETHMRWIILKKL